MKNIIIIILLAFTSNLSFSQGSDKDFKSVYNKVNEQNIFVIEDEDKETFSKDSAEIVEMKGLLNFLNDYIKDERSLNGDAGFSFSGSENDLNNLFDLGVSGSMDMGAYPSELDFNLQIQTTIQNGFFSENLSNVDMSYDFHPYIPKAEKKSDGLWLENFLFIKRFNNSFLGIEQRYETGAGVIFNFYSKKLTQAGNDNQADLDNIPKYDIYGNDLRRCLETCYLKESVLDLNENDIDVLVNTRERFSRTNRKQYSKLRLALLVGFYYELEQAFAENEILFNQKDSIMNVAFDATNKLRWEIRPSLTWQPKDGYKLKIYPFFKLPIGNVFDTTNPDDKLYDYFLDFYTSLQIDIEDNFFISLNYRLMYDNAPRRIFLQQNDGSFVLLTGQKQHSNYTISLNFAF